MIMTLEINCDRQIVDIMFTILNNWKRQVYTSNEKKNRDCDDTIYEFWK